MLTIDQNNELKIFSFRERYVAKIFIIFPLFFLTIFFGTFLPSQYTTYTLKEYASEYFRQYNLISELIRQHKKLIHSDKNKILIRFYLVDRNFLIDLRKKNHNNQANNSIILYNKRITDLKNAIRETSLKNKSLHSKIKSIDKPSINNLEIASLISICNTLKPSTFFIKCHSHIDIEATIDNMEETLNTISDRINSHKGDFLDKQKIITEYKNIKKEILLFINKKIESEKNISLKKDKLTNIFNEVKKFYDIKSRLDHYIELSSWLLFVSSLISYTYLYAMRYLKDIIRISFINSDQKREVKATLLVSFNRKIHKVEFNKLKKTFLSTLGSQNFHTKFNRIDGNGVEIICQSSDKSEILRAINLTEDCLSKAIEGNNIKIKDKRIDIWDKWDDPKIEKEIEQQNLIPVLNRKEGK